MSDLRCQILSDDFPNFDLSFKLIIQNKPIKNIY